MAEIINLLEYISATHAGKDSLSDGSIIKVDVKVGKESFNLTLETDMWIAFRSIASREQSRIEDMCFVILKIKPRGMSLSSAIRSFVVDYYRAAATEEGHRKAGHGIDLHEQPKTLH